MWATESCHSKRREPEAEFQSTGIQGWGYLSIFPCEILKSPAWHLCQGILWQFSSLFFSIFFFWICLFSYTREDNSVTFVWHPLLLFGEYVIQSMGISRKKYITIIILYAWIQNILIIIGITILNIYLSYFREYRICSLVLLFKIIHHWLSIKP